ncbi:D-alanine--D-alanine ligase [Bradyrhizobium oligotrophicum S58]|uniref:D-alanine--D-alanine ligase n=1 Tax=Bradyrhizobium oligotrophicum S58 TaxID=1245469 RepID=M4Z4N5_9BRAD|nr:D-alanine--D-alanine ligase [Bradyrhizobium oligotrophicum]BAM87967.1 D-alanine--D-alanine ligase [Bradyrhizobium oligotrophicum S58]
MHTTILFGGSNKERLVSVASAKALHAALPEADLWFWEADDTVHQASGKALVAHAKPFEEAFTADGATVGTLGEALDRARAEDRVLVLGLHGGRAENGELQLMCELRGVPFTGSSSAASHLAFDKVAAKRFAVLGGVTVAEGVALDDAEAALARYGKLIAKPVKDGSSFGLIFVNALQDLVAVRGAATTEEYLIEPFVTGTEATCGVLEQSDGSLIALPPIEILPADGAFNYFAKYLAAATKEICPGRFSPEITAALQEEAIKAHRALSCGGYSRTDFIVSSNGPVYLETNTLPGLTAASLYPKALQAQGIAFVDFLNQQIALAERRVRREGVR